MSSQDPGETKERILCAARELFSQLGYDGASVRQIAEKSGVNVAAVNYHFQTKHGLYWAIIDEAHDWLESGVKSIMDNASDMESLTRAIFRFMRSGEAYVRSTMKTFLTDGVPKGSQDGSDKCEDFGPPGGKYIFDFLRREHDESISDEAIQWAVFTIFSNLFHWATMCSSSAFRERKPEFMNDQVIEDNIVHASRAVIEYMKSSKKGQFRC